MQHQTKQAMQETALRRQNSQLAETMSQLKLHHKAVAQPQSYSALFILTVPGSVQKFGCRGRVQALVITQLPSGSIANLSPKPGPAAQALCKRSQPGWAPLPCMKCREGFAYVAETCGSGAGISHEAMRGAVQARRAQLQLGRQFSVMFLLGGFHMPIVSRGRIHACEVLLLSPSLCVILSLSCI